MSQILHLIGLQFSVASAAACIILLMGLSSRDALLAALLAFNITAIAVCSINLSKTQD